MASPANLHTEDLPADTVFFRARSSPEVIIACTPAGTYWEYWPPPRAGLTGWATWGDHISHTPTHLRSVGYREIDRDTVLTETGRMWLSELRVGAGL